MISTNTFINKIRSMGYHFKKQLPRVRLFRLEGGTEVIFVPRRDKLEDEWVLHTLRQKGLSREEVLDFISSAKI